MEVRCENRSEENAYTGYDNACWSHENQGSMEMAADTQASVKTVFKSIEKDSLKNGWKKIKGEWFCPHCVPIVEAINAAINSERG